MPRLRHAGRRRGAGLVGPRERGGPAPELSVGRYRLLRLVGRGGMGEVYAAHDPELDRKVAIKILRADARPDNIEAARLAREAQAVARLSHPNVVAIYDVGSSAGRMFLAMELVEGETLAVWLAQGTRTPSEILTMFLMAGRGLAAAHRAGIVHRDFKPQNVMVASDGSARVMDFGLAAAGGAGSPASSPHQGGRHPRNAALHVARADGRAAGRSACRSIQLLRRALGGAARRAPVRGDDLARASGATCWRGTRVPVRCGAASPGVCRPRSCEGWPSIARAASPT